MKNKITSGIILTCLSTVSAMMIPDFGRMAAILMVVFVLITVYCWYAIFKDLDDMENSVPNVRVKKGPNDSIMLIIEGKEATTYVSITESDYTKLKVSGLCNSH